MSKASIRMLCLNLQSISLVIIMRKVFLDETVKKLEFQMPVAFHSHVMLKLGNDPSCPNH